MRDIKSPPVIHYTLWGFGLIIVLFCFVGVVSWIEINSLNRLTSKIYKHPLEVSTTSLRASLGVVKMHRSMKDVVLADEHLPLDIAISLVADEENIVLQKLSFIEERILGVEGKALVKETKELFINWKPIREEVIDLVKKGESHKAAFITKEKGASYELMLEQKMSELTSYARAKADGFAQEADNIQKRTTLIISFSVTLGLILSIVIIFFTSRKIKNILSIHKKAEQALGERVKELNCLYSISNLIEKEHITTETILQSTVDLIPPSWQYPEMTCAGIRLYDLTYKTDNYKETNWLLAHDIIINKEKVGAIEVYFLGENPLNEESPFLREEGDLLHVIAERLGHIIKRKQVEKSLVESEERFRKAITLSPFPSMIHSEEGNIILINETWKELTGYTEQDIPTIADWTERAYGERKEVIREEISKLFKMNGRIDEGLYNVTTKDGRTIIWDFYSAPLGKLTDGKRLVISKAKDITEEVAAEKERKNLESRLNQAQKMEAIGTLAGGIAHDFNNILAVILGYVDMAKDDAPPGTQFDRDLDKVLVAANRAKELVKQILAFSRQAQVERIPIKMQPLIKEGLKMLRSSIPSTISMIEDIAPDSGVILADPTQVHQILMNLCTNAYHAMEETGGILSVTLKTTLITPDNQEMRLHAPPGEYIQLSVADTGVGIGPDIIEHIFDPYFTTKGVGKGSGMGLAIIHGIIKAYGGAITVESQLGKGTTFHVYIPVIDINALPQNRESDDIPTGEERILFIDDEAILAQMGKDMLERLGYQVTVQRSSLEALTLFQNAPNEFDVVITDQTMPDMTGSDLSRRMLQIRPDIPIILCTGYSNLIDEDSAKALGIKEFALKPLTKRMIANLIRKVLNGGVTVDQIINQNDP